MRVLGNRVLVKRVEEKPVTSAIIEIVQGYGSTPEPSIFALVAEVGQGQRLPSGGFIPIECSVGDLVIVKKYSGAPLTLTNNAGMQEEFHLVAAEDVLAVVEK